MDEINDQLHSSENNETNSMDDSLKVDGRITKISSHHDRLQCISNNDSLTKIDKVEVEEKSSFNESTSSKLIEQKKTENSETNDNIKIEASDSLAPARNIANSTILNTFKNQIVSPTQKTNVPLNLEKIEIPKTNTLDIKLSSPIMSDQTEVTPSIFTVSPATVKPITTATMPLPLLNTTEINCNKAISKQVQGIKITSSKDSSNVVLVPHNGVNYVIKNPNESAEQKNQLLLTQLTDAKKISTFVTRMQKLPDGKYKMLAPAGDLPIGLETLFNQNSHFVKQKKNSDSTEKEPKVSYFFKSPLVDSGSKETNSFQNDSQVLLNKVNCTESSSVSSNNEETNHNETKLQDSYKEANCMEETSSVSSNNEETDHSETKSQDSYKEANCMEDTYSVSSNYEETDQCETKSEDSYKEANCMEDTSSVSSNNEETNHNETKLQDSYKEANCMEETSSVSSNNEETNHSETKSQDSYKEAYCMEDTSSVSSNNEETNHSETKLQDSYKEANCMEETSSVSSNHEETDHSETKLQDSYKEANCMEETSSVSSNNEETNHSETKLQDSYKEANCMEETSSVSSNHEETDHSETKLQDSYKEANCMEETSSVSSNNEETNNSETKSQDSYKETECTKTSSINSMTEKTKNNKIYTSSVDYRSDRASRIQKKLKLTSEQMNRIGTPLVDPNILIRIKREAPPSPEYSYTNNMKASYIDFTEETDNVQNETQETNSMEVSSINFDTDELDKKTHSIDMEFVNSVSEEASHVEKNSQEMHSNETSSVPFTSEILKTIHQESQLSSEETNEMGTASDDSFDEKTTNIENDLKKLSEEISRMETSSVISINEESNKFKKDIENLSEKISCLETSLANSIDEEANNSENNLEKSSGENSCMETSAVNSTTEKNYIIKKESKESSQETNRIVTSPVNSFVGKTYHNQKKLIITSDQIKCMGTPVVDPDILRRINKEKSTHESNSSNIIFKAPDIRSYQRHKIIVSRSTADKRYAMKNINDAKDKVKIKTVGNQELCTSPHSFLRFLPKKSQPTIQTNNQPLIIRKYDSSSSTKTNLNPNFNSSGKKVLVKIVKSDGGEQIGRIIPAEEIKKLFPRVINSSKVTQLEENPRKNKISPSEEIQPEKRIKVSVKEENRKFIACKNKYCTSLTHDIIRPELIDNLYCSLACKMLDSKQMETENKSGVQTTEDPSKKPIIDRKKLLETLKNRINKRKQPLPSCYTEKVTCKVRCDEPKIIEIPSTKPSIKIESVTQKPPDSLRQIIPISVKDLEGFKIKKQKSKVSTVSNVVSNLTIKDILVTNEITSKYLKKFTPAPKKLFDSPFPREKNCFKVGHKLEGIDPTHEALFCVLTVVEVCGYRIKLHFDGYPANYDFWVNANNPDLFYTNWCKEHNRSLELPRGYKKNFDWHEYFEENGGAIPAPRINFISTKNLDSVSTHLFHVGEKLEALDKMTRTLSKQLICVATVADVLANRIRIHFDGWSNDFDYWADITSTNLHPIGWCDKNGRNLCPPNGYDDQKKKKPFTWAQYLQETNSDPVSEDAFVRRPLREFSFNMAIEVVDLVVPSLIRVAKVVDVKGNELKILYDGFDNKYAYWIDDDSPDIHPLGWCLKTNHPLEIPSGELLCCKVVGCNGKGNSNSLKINHFTFKDCPYDFDKWEKVVSGLPSIPDRLTLKDLPVKTKRPRKKYPRGKNKIISQPKPNPSKDLLIDPRKKIIQKQKEKIMQMQKQGLIKIQKQEIIQKKHNKKAMKSKFKKRRLPLIKSNEMMKNRVDALFKVMTDIENLAEKSRERNLYRPHFELKGRVWPQYPILKLPDAVHDVRQWSTEEVGYFVDKLISLNSTYRSPKDEVLYAERFIKKQIDGKKFLNLSQDFFTKSMKIPLGTALKISNGIKKLRRQFPDLIFKDESYRF